VSFDLKPGEVLGITGLLGSGRTELALSLFGEMPANSGTIRIEGREVRIQSIQDAMKQPHWVRAGRPHPGRLVPGTIDPG
jgi:simple sugar transport system ATP-binding protein